MDREQIEKLKWRKDGNALVVRNNGDLIFVAGSSMEADCAVSQHNAAIARIVAGIREEPAQESTTTAGFFAANPQDATKIQNSVPDLKGFTVSIKRIADGTTQIAQESATMSDELRRPHQNGPFSVCSDGGIEYCRIHGPRGGYSSTDGDVLKNAKHDHK